MEPLFLLLGLFNLFTASLMYMDKKRAKAGQWRIPEKRFWIMASLGGSVGIYVGMRLFRHKTKHASFRFGIPLLLFIQLGLIYYLWSL